MIIGLVGLPAAGKGTIGKYLLDKHHAVALRFSDPLRDIIHRVYQDPTREGMSNLAEFLRREYGNDILIQTLLLDTEKSSASLFVLDGMRYWDEYDLLRKRKDFVCWAVDTTLEHRYERIVKRDENASDKGLTLEQFKVQHRLPTEVMIPDMMKKSDATLDNNSDLASLYARVDQLVQAL